MFTGIIEEIGIVTGINKTRTGVSLKLKTANIHSDSKIGDSIAINGVCLTVSAQKGKELSFDVIPETLTRTNLGELKLRDSVNMERSLRVDSRLGGHFVSGHIDYKGKINRLLKDSGGIGFEITLPIEFSKLVVEKGSITLDGVSLTVASVSRESLTVYLIPHTLKVTTFGNKKKGDSLNVEIDLLAKYVAKQTKKSDLENILKKYDYI
ncbi:MAG: riboflavin synthase [Candidatus Omnitrophica bacterium]|nr:riboflavin synthase [Candidatus Omnitrophota bacterium]